LSHWLVGLITARASKWQHIPLQATAKNATSNILHSTEIAQNPLFLATPLLATASAGRASVQYCEVMP
jgi:hypothetical protein